MANEGQGHCSNTRKRKLVLGSDSIDSIMRRTFGNQNITSSNTANGPIYPDGEGSFVLNRTSLSECEEEVFSVNNPNGIVPVVVHPELVAGRNGSKLSDEQREGIQFMWDRYVKQKGGILAHDMGLGKTRTGITVIATLLQQSDRSRGTSTPALNKAIVIAPLNAVSVWKDEFNKWCPDDICKVITVLSSQSDGWEIVNEFRQSNSLNNVMILSYETFKKYMKNFREGLYQYTDDSIGLVICDEAHRLKNKDTQLVKVLKQFRGAKLWMGMTGTPYQNSLDELCSLVEFFCRDLEVHDLKRKYSKPITDTLRKLKKLTPPTQTLLMELRSLLRPTLNYKKNSFNIDRHEVLINVALDGHPDYFKLPAQNRQFQVQHKMYELISQCLERTNEIIFNEKISYLTKTCIHPDDAYKALKKHPIIFREAIEYFEANYPELGQNNEGRYIAETFSTKIRLATKMVQYICDKNSDEKIIIVSSSTVLLRKIEGIIKAILKLRCLTYDGQKSHSERDTAVASFENDDRFRVLLLSLKAGGTALTLTRANHLLMLDPDYNPSNDQQAFARIYRPGQNRTAFIYRFICTGTLEEVKLIRQLEKESMGNTIRASDEDVKLDVKAPYIEKELLQYFPNTRSHLNDKLDEIQISEFNSDDDSEGSNFGFELKNAKKYRAVFEVPDELDILRGEVWESISHCFHLNKKANPIIQYVLNDEIQIDGDVPRPFSIDFTEDFTI